MYLCQCNGITKGTIEQLVDAGARSVADVERRCGAGNDCGNCRRAIHDLIAERPAERAPVEDARPDSMQLVRAAC